MNDSTVGTMAGSEAVIDQIVAAVLDQLRSEATAAATVAPASAGGPIELPETVITARLLEERRIGAGSVVVGAKAVLTPSALDYLTGRKITWTRLRTADQSSAKLGRWLAVVSRDTPAVGAALDSNRQETQSRWTREIAGCHREASQRAVAALCRGECEGVVIFTAQPESAACLANRHQQVRAAALATGVRLERVRAELGPNVWTIDPGERSAIELRRFLREIDATGRPAAPTGWKE